jgi:high-affinity iron transporter
MFTTGLIVFRESLEAALFIGIVAAATQGLPGRARWLSAGVAVGLLAALALAWLAPVLGEAMSGLGQDAMNVMVLSAALLMLLWHCIWSARHARAAAGEARTLGASVSGGQQAPWALFVAVSLCVLREGAETVLFVSGSLTGAAPLEGSSLLLSAATGLGLGVSFGVALHAGLTRLPTRQVFMVTQAFIAVLAGSMASQLARALSQAGWLEAGGGALWDSSAWVAPGSALGTLLQA